MGAPAVGNGSGSVNGNSNGKQFITRIAENSATLIFARLLMPIALAIIGYLMVLAINSALGKIDAQSVKIDALQAVAAATQGDVKQIAAKVDGNRELADSKIGDLKTIVDRLGFQFDLLQRNVAPSAVPRH